MNPSLIKNKNHIIRIKPCSIKALNTKTTINEKVITTLFKEFGEDSPCVTFYLCHFHEYFDGIIGHDILSKCGIQIDFADNVLRRGDNEIQISHKPLTCEYEYIIKAKSMNKLKFPVDVEFGSITLEEQSFCDTVLVGGLYEAISWEAEIVVENKSINDVKIKVSQPMKVNAVEILEMFNIEDNIDNVTKGDILNKIRSEHLNNEEKAELEKLVLEFANIFHTEDRNLTFTNGIKHEIKTTDELPVYTKTYRYPYIHKEEVQRQVQDMLDQNIIRPSYSPWSSPVWIVPKKTDASGQKKWRLVVDYRKLNEKTINDKYPIPNISEILDKLGKSMYFTTLDLASGFHQIEVHPKDVTKTAFTVENGHYEYTRMPFGLKNAPATFQRIMDGVLKELQNKICLVYMDDIIIYSTSLIEHIQNLRKVFNALKNANLKIQLDKSEFLQREVKFLGHIITEEGIRPNPDKIKAVRDYPIPKSPKEIKQFLGLLGYYRKFIKDFAKLTKPFTTKLKKDEKINTNDIEYRECFENCKNMLINDPILIYPNFEKQFILTTDASNFALGAVLSQIQDNKEHPVCYASRTLNNHEQNYSTIEKELLAIVWATKYFRPYLFGRLFKIQTDHKPLNWLMSLKEPNSKLVRWRLRLEEFNYQIEYKPGKKNNNADTLSRIPVEININEDEDTRSTGTTAHSAESDGQYLIPISESSLNQFKFQFIISRIHSGAASIKRTKIFNNTRTTIKLKETDEITLVNLMKTHFNPKQVNAIKIDDTDLFLEFQETYEKHFGRNKRMRMIKCTILRNDVTDELEQDKLIMDYHKENNHRGINECFEHLKRQYYFPNLKLKIQTYINQCEICQTEKYERHPVKQKFCLTQTPKRPLEICHCDIFFINRDKPLLTIIDKFSRYAQAYSLVTRNTPHIREAIMKFISQFGKPKLIVTDQESSITTIEMKEFLNENNIEIHYTSVDSSNSNSPVERFHSTLLEHLRIVMNNNDLSFKESIYKALFGYNNSIHQITKFTPFELFFGRRYDDVVEPNTESIEHARNQLHEEAHMNSLENKQKYIDKQNENRSEPLNLPTDKDLYRKQKTTKKMQPRQKKLRISRQKSNVVFDNTDKKFHKNKIIKPRTFQVNGNAGTVPNRDTGRDSEPRTSSTEN